jgi:hypothetical protein
MRPRGCAALVQEEALSKTNILIFYCPAGREVPSLGGLLDQTVLRRLFLRHLGCATAANASLA